MNSDTWFGWAAVTLALGLLSYGAWSVGAGVAVTLLLLLRFVEGIFLGGEYTAATPLAVEYAPANRRGLVASCVQCAASIGPFFVALVLFLVSLIFGGFRGGFGRRL